MKFYHFFLLFSLLPLEHNAQLDSTNLGEYNFSKSAPTLKYKYNAKNQTHDYSGNWDFDNDGKFDSLFFVGNNAAHIYYHLKIVLSTNNEISNFPFLELEFPRFENINELKQANFYPLPQFPKFVVYDFDSDGIDEIFLNLDNKTIIPKKMQKSGLTSKYILLDFLDKKMIVKNFL